MTRQWQCACCPLCICKAYNWEGYNCPHVYAWPNLEVHAAAIPPMPLPSGTPWSILSVVIGYKRFSRQIMLAIDYSVLIAERSP